MELMGIDVIYVLNLNGFLLWELKFNVG